MLRNTRIFLIFVYVRFVFRGVVLFSIVRCTQVPEHGQAVALLQVHCHHSLSQGMID